MSRYGLLCAVAEWRSETRSLLPLCHHSPQEASGVQPKKPGIVRKREEFQAADEGAAGPTGSKRAYLKARSSELGLDEKVGKTQVSFERVSRGFHDRFKPTTIVTLVAHANLSLNLSIPPLRW